jgi:hypothetical protein
VLSDVRPKAPVVALVERQGNVRSMVMRVTAANLKNATKKHVAPFSAVVTDESPKYKSLGKQFHHHTAHHSRKQYTVKFNDKFTIHSNTVEISFALLKRGIVGTFHQVSEQHLPLYLAEFDHRWNHRKTTDGERTVAGLKMIEGKRLIYKKKAAK